MNRFAARAAMLVVAGAALVVTPSRGATAPAAAIAPPTNDEITRFLALTADLAGDAGRTKTYCALQAGSAGDDKTEQTPAAIGRKLEANPMFGALLRRHSFSGQRYTEVSLQIFGGALGLGMADDLDQSARAKGKPATSREGLLQKSAEARAVAPRLAEITTALQKVNKLCDADDDEGGDPEGDDNP